MLFQSRLFIRIISKSREAYILKIVTLTIAFACSALIALFSLNEFGYDRFHLHYPSVFRVLQRNNSETHNGNRLSNQIPYEIYSALQSKSDSILLARVKVMEEVSVRVGEHLFRDQKVHAADPALTNIFTFDFLDGSAAEFDKGKQVVMLSSTTAQAYFGSIDATGKEISIHSLGDTLHFKVAAVYKDFPQNSHEQFNMFIRFDESSISALRFDPKETGLYGTILRGEQHSIPGSINKSLNTDELTYQFQPLSEIYFGPRVMGEDARHGDHYSILLLICINLLILFLAVTSFVNLTTLTLPYRSKELAIKKLAGTGQWNLLVSFAMESFSIVSISLVLGILLLALTSIYIEPILAINPISLLLRGDVYLIIILIVLFLMIGLAPLFMVLKFAKATPTRLLSTETITFPRFKKTIIILQLGVSIFLIVASMVISRQVNYSLLKEPGRNHDQIVYLSYPKDLTNEGLLNLRANWKKYNPNIIEVMATSQLPNRISSKELNSEFYFMSVDREFLDFFNLKMIEGNWFKANDGDSIMVINELGKKILRSDVRNVAGVFEDMSGQFNQPEKAIKINIAPYFHYNFLCVRILEVDIRKTVQSLSNQFEKNGNKPTVSYLNKRFEEWLSYQDRLNALSKILTIISGVLSCFAIYGLSIGIVRDKIKQIAIHKLCGASTLNITRLLVQEFTRQMIIAILIFGPLTYIILSELLRSFVYSTPFHWLDPLFPLTYCGIVIALLCGFQALSLNREDLSTALKG